MKKVSIAVFLVLALLVGASNALADTPPPSSPPSGGGGGGVSTVKVIGGGSFILPSEGTQVIKGGIVSEVAADCVARVSYEMSPVSENNLSISLRAHRQDVVERLRLEDGRTALDIKVPAGSLYVPVRARIKNQTNSHLFVDYTLMIVGTACTPPIPGQAPLVTLLNTSITGLTAPSGQSSPQEAEGRIRFNLTAIGGDVYIRDVVSAATGGVQFVSTIASNAEMGQSLDYGTTFLVRAGETKWFEVFGHLANTGNEPISAKMVVMELQWATSPNEAPTQMLEVDFQTATIYLHPPETPAP
ncbi:MAG: hypothetical protein AAB524_00465 [Patescibacteria group bacterium]